MHSHRLVVHIHVQLLIVQQWLGGAQQTVQMYTSVRAFEDCQDTLMKTTTKAAQIKTTA